MYEHTFLRENDSLGIVAPTFNSPCLDAIGNPVKGFSDPSQCAAAGLQPNDGSNPNLTLTPFNPVLLPFDLTRGGGLYSYFGHTDVKELALYAEDQIKAGNWLFNLGIRGDLYNGLTIGSPGRTTRWASLTASSQPTLCCVSRMRARWKRHSMRIWCSPAKDAEMSCCRRFFSARRAFRATCNRDIAMSSTQASSRLLESYVVVSGDYIWKYTHNAFDFSVLGNTPITFPSIGITPRFRVLCCAPMFLTITTSQRSL